MQLHCMLLLIYSESSLQSAFLFYALIGQFLKNCILEIMYLDS